MIFGIQYHRGGSTSFHTMRTSLRNKNVITSQSESMCPVTSRLTDTNMNNTELDTYT